MYRVKDRGNVLAFIPNPPPCIKLYYLELHYASSPWFNARQRTPKFHLSAWMKFLFQLRGSNTNSTRVSLRGWGACSSFFPRVFVTLLAIGQRKKSANKKARKLARFASRLIRWQVVEEENEEKGVEKKIRDGERMRLWFFAKLRGINEKPSAAITAAGAGLV